MRYSAVIGTWIAVCLCLAINTMPAYAHWDMEPRFWADDAKDKFHLRIHNGAHANRNPVKKELNVCFWLEGLLGSAYGPVSEKQCSTVLLKPDEWLDFVFDLRDTAMLEKTENGGKLRKGSYRAVVVAREEKGRLAKILFGAALERLYSYFEVK